MQFSKKGKRNGGYAMEVLIFPKGRESGAPKEQQTIELDDDIPHAIAADGPPLRPALCTILRATLFASAFSPLPLCRH
jgi:hypothetical protein